MARPATGSARWNPTAATWEVRITIAGKRQPPVAVEVPQCLVVPNAPPPKCTCASCAQARRVAKLVSDEYRSRGLVPEHTEETANEWHVRYIKLHGELGNETRGQGSWERWCAPHFGTTPIARVTRDQIIATRNGMTAATLAKDGPSAKRIANLWSELIKAPFSRAFCDDDPKYSTVRVGPYAANPATGVKPPVTSKEKDDDARERQPLFPREFARVMACAAVPVEWRQLYAVATFLFLRPEELYGLRWSDVDWDAEEVRVRRALDLRTGDEKRPKTKAAIREVPIHPNLMPLLAAMRAGKDASDRVVPIATRTRDVEKNADMVRKHLRAAGIERSELFDGTDDLMPFDFRSLRTTGCTWHAMQGTDSWVLARWAGHTSPEVTWAHYAKQGPDLRRRHGEPFPALPAALTEPPEGFGGVSAFWSGGVSDSASLQCEGGDLNPYGVTR